MSSPTKKRLVRFAVQVAVAALCLWFAFRGVHLQQVLEILARSSPWLVGAACLCTLLMNMAKCGKLGLLLAPERRVRYSTLLTAELTSVLVDVVFPLRLQELVKAFIIGRRAGIRPSLVFGAEVVEKAVEVLFLTSVMITIWLLVPTPVWADGFLLAMGGVVIVALAFLSLLLVRPRALDRPVLWLASRQLPAAARVADILGSLSDGLRTATRRPAALGGVVLLTLVEWCFLAAACYLCALAVDIPLSTEQLLAVLVANFLAFAVPTSTGGSVGIYELAGKSALVLIFGMDPTRALVLVVLFHAVMVGFGAITGAVALALSRFSFRGVKAAMDDPELLEKLESDP